MAETEARDLLLHILAEAATRGEIQPIRPAVQVGQPVRCAVPERLTVSLDSLRTLARLAGFKDLREAFLAVEPDDLEVARPH
jgi:hypothetical protein